MVGGDMRQASWLFQKELGKRSVYSYSYSYNHFFLSVFFFFFCAIYSFLNNITPSQHQATFMYTSKSRVVFWSYIKLELSQLTYGSGMIGADVLNSSILTDTAWKLLPLPPISHDLRALRPRRASSLSVKVKGHCFSSLNLAMYVLLLTSIYLTPGKYIY